MPGSCLGHGGYDLSMLDDKVLEGQVTREEIEKVVYEMQKSEFWIPAFPNDGKAASGWIIVMVLGLWVSVFLLLGGIHQVLGLSAFLVTAGALLLAYVISVGAYYWAHNDIGDQYLTKREKSLIDVAEKFNAENSSRGFKIEIGRYGAYIALRFGTPIKQLGAMLMQYQRIYKKSKEADNIKKQQDADIL